MLSMEDQLSRARQKTHAQVAIMSPCFIVTSNHFLPHSFPVGRLEYCHTALFLLKSIYQPTLWARKALGEGLRVHSLVAALAENQEGHEWQATWRSLTWPQRSGPLGFRLSRFWLPSTVTTDPYHPTLLAAFSVFLYGPFCLFIWQDSWRTNMNSQQSENWWEFLPWENTVH